MRKANFLEAKHRSILLIVLASILLLGFPTSCATTKPADFPSSDVKSVDAPAHQALRSGKENGQMNGSYLNHDELEQLFRTNRTASYEAAGETVRLKFYPDGTQVLHYSRGTDRGIFRIDDNQYCSSWRRIRSGREVCARFYKIGDAMYNLINDDGSFRGTLEFTDAGQGN